MNHQRCLQRGCLRFKKLTEKVKSPVLAMAFLTFAVIVSNWLLRAHCGRKIEGNHLIS